MQPDYNLLQRRFLVSPDCRISWALKPSLPLPAKTAKLRSFPLLTVTQGFCQFMVCFGPEFISDVAECPDVVAPEKCLSFETFKGFQNEVKSPIQIIDGFIQTVFESSVKASALGLRRKDGAFNF